MISLLPSHLRHHTDFGWLSTRWHFSFDSYFDPENVQWGALRVFNDDVVQPGKGFPTHSHRDMEIVSVVLEGALEHADNLGTKQVLTPGEVQVMSAGSGIRHSEYNPSSDEPVHFLQLWILPRSRGSAPRWDQRAFPDRAGKLLPVVSSGEIENTLAIDQDSTVYLSTLEPGQSVSHTALPGRKAYLFLMKGSADLNGHKVENGDQARIDNEPLLKMTALERSELILLDLPA